MRILVVDDDFINRKLMQKYLRDFGATDVAMDGDEAVQAYEESLKANEPYVLICLDIMMPKLDGQQTLKKIRELESEYKAERTKVIMTTALGDSKSILQAFREQCDGYLVKPITKTKLVDILKELELLDND